MSAADFGRQSVIVQWHIISCGVGVGDDTPNENKSILGVLASDKPV